MSDESHNLDRKSLRVLTVRNPDWDGLARDCVAFANAQGGHLFIGIEDGATEPPAGQQAAQYIERVRRRIGELTVNVTVAVETRRSETTGGEYLDVSVPRSAAPASTTDGRYYLRVSDESKPLVGEEVQRLLNERSAQPWETLTTLGIPRDHTDPDKVETFAARIRESDRVKESVKEKSDSELLDHYYLAIGDHLTNLGILCVGRREDRARLGTAPVVQFIKYDEAGRKVNKIAWDDHDRSPMELIEAVWQEVPDFRESYELPDGLFRQHLPIYDEVVVRELLVNALVHRPYTQRGDVYLNLHPDRLEIVNPGLLPLGVTPRNVLHQSVRRNNELARVFHDLKLMEREGSGYDRMYEILLSQGRPLPELREGSDRVAVTVYRRVIRPEVVDFLAKADQAFQLSQRERIVLGLILQTEAVTARDLAGILELSGTAQIGSWMGRLQQFGIVRQTGKTKGTRYYVDPKLLRDMDFSAVTTLSRIEPHRLEALVTEDLRRYPGSAIGQINQRIGSEIDRHYIKRVLNQLVDRGIVEGIGEKRGRKYRLSE